MFDLGKTRIRTKVKAVDKSVENLGRAGGLVGGAAKLEKAAVGWWTVAYTVPTRRLRRVEDGADEEGTPVRHMETFDEVNTVVRGWRGSQAFLAAWSAGKAECAYWWTREHEAWAELPRERVTWTTPQPTPVRVSFKELTRLVKTADERSELGESEV